MTQPVVVELVAECELLAAHDGGTSFTVVEYAALSDGRRVTLLDDRGWTQWTVGAAAPPPLSADEVRQGVRNVVLPDNAEETGDDHEWARFADRLQDAGVAVTSEELRSLPYRIAFGERLLAALTEG